MEGRTIAIGMSLLASETTCSANAFVNVYVLGQVPMILKRIRNYCRFVICVLACIEFICKPYWAVCSAINSSFIQYVACIIFSTSHGTG